MLLTLAVVGPAHALKGEVRLEIRTDDPEGRLAPGTTVPTEPAHAGPLTVSRLRFDGSPPSSRRATARPPRPCEE